MQALWQQLDAPTQQVIIAAVAGLLAGPILSVLQQVVTVAKWPPGLTLDSSTAKKRVVSVIAACLPAAIAAADTHNWQPVLAAGVVAWAAGQATHGARKRRARVTADAPEDPA